MPYLSLAAILLITIFRCKETDTQLCEELRIQWCTRFKLLGLCFDQTVEDMKVNYEAAKSKVKAMANRWKNRYVSVYGKLCIVKTLPKLIHILTVLTNLGAKQIKGAARADLKTIHG